MGKSSLFNAIVGQMISIVDPMAGVTRDRVSAIVCHDDRYFELVDTGGYGIVDSEDLSKHIENQIFQALAAARRSAMASTVARSAVVGEPKPP